MNLKELRDKFTKLVESKDALKSKIESEKRDYNDTEKVELRKMVDDMEKTMSDIELAKKLDETEERAKSIKPVGKPEERLDIKPAAETEYRLGEFLVDVAKASGSGDVSNRLAFKQKQQRAILGASESVPSGGGYLVDKEMLGGIFNKMYENSVVASMCTKVPVGANYNGVKINGIDETSRADGSRFGGLKAYWIAEGGTKQDTNPKFRQISLELNKLATLFYSTDELLQDAPALEAMVTEFVGQEMAFRVQDAIINGDGVGKPLGITNAPCLITQAKEVGQLADTILYENIVNMYSRVWMPSNRKNKVWLASQSTIPQLMQLALPVGTGGSAAWLPANGLAGQPYDTLMGLPIIYTEQNDQLGDQNDIILADLSQYILADKGGLQFASSMHVQFITDQSTFRWVYRVDGQPMWHSAITPFSGGPTQSPFVTLAERA